MLEKTADSGGKGNRSLGGKTISLIGLLIKETQRTVAEEFFQLFKVQWGYYANSIACDVVIISDNVKVIPKTKLVIIYGSEKIHFDEKNNIRINSIENNGMLNHDGIGFPIYTKMLTFPRAENTFLEHVEANQQAGMAIDEDGRRILRIGYDLFGEVEYLLSNGQPVEYAGIPTMEIHISLLRDLITGSGIPLAEIPPSPHGYDFSACLTHDIDFMNIRDHKCDHTIFGFLYRALIPFASGSNITWKKYLKNLKAVLSLPGIHMGLLPDFWDSLSRYSDLERETKSTFFFIPFQNCPGDTIAGGSINFRAAKYDVCKHADSIRELVRNGHEVGLHGIDAWADSEKGRRERHVIQEISGEETYGIRMHWLFFSGNTGRVLEEAGFAYDSTLGYNDTIGFRQGTTQVFRLPGTEAVYELPLHIQDSAMFFPGRMGLGESKALELCVKLLDVLKSFGGVVTVNWHDRSLVPERNWDEFYMELLQMLKRKRVWFATANQAVTWFKKRRSMEFEYIRIQENKIYLKVRTDQNDLVPGYSLRVWSPVDRSRQQGEITRRYKDIPLLLNEEMMATAETI